MFYTNSVTDIRQTFATSWSKYLKKQELSALEAEIVAVIQMHPEYIKTIEQMAIIHDHAYYPELGESNPFLHLGLHLALREQIATNRPVGIKAIYNTLVHKHQDALTVEHLMMEHLAECLWLAQKNNALPDEQYYLTCLAKL